MHSHSWESECVPHGRVKAIQCFINFYQAYCTLSASVATTTQNKKHNQESNSDLTSAFT
eukprot:m.1362 g.1362  ORF g.1362 m.1362 type:complete len:59 (-) comp654_c0_seq1:133-309(-)